MSKLNPKKLSVEFRKGVTTTEPIIPRRYTLTHSDITAELFLTIGLRYANDKITAMRDEVLGEWIKKGDSFFFHVYLYVDGQFTVIRNYIFRRELPLALEAIRYGDREFFSAHPELKNSPIIVHFMSIYPQFNRIENWGSFPSYRLAKTSSTSSEINKSILELSNKFRELWEQHGAWTRMTIMSIVFGLPDVDFVTSRLLQNPVDFGNTLKVFYSNKIALKFSNLLKDHLVIAAQLVKAAKAGDNEAAADAEKRWYSNADEIAAFLASINPYWSEKDWKTMLHKHLMLVKAEAVAILTKDYVAGIKVYDEIEKQSLGMADAMTQGIVKQFPGRFIR